MKKFKRLLSVLVMVIVLTMSFVTAFADLSAEDEAWLQANLKIEDGVIKCAASNGVASYLTLDSSASGDNNVVVTIDGNPVYLRKGKTTDEVHSAIDVSTVLGSGARTRDEIVELGMNPNFIAARTMLSGFMPIVQIFVGLIVILITVGMTIFSAFDIAYIAFPVFRNKCEDAKVNGSKTMTKTNSNGETSLRFVTDDAQYAVKEGSIESGKSPWGIYFKKRVMSYILLAIILFILMTGNINLITDIALTAVSGIMGVLSSLA